MSETQPVAPSDAVTLLDHVSMIVVAYVSKNPIPVSDIPVMIRSVHGALVGVSGSSAPDQSSVLKPAVPVKKSVTRDYLICLEDGNRCKTLKRYLKSRYNLSPDEYRTKWGLPRDYPMVAPDYAERRSQLAKKSGLGRKPGVKLTKKRSERR